MGLIAIAAGGTAGHVNPALALSAELASRGHEIRFFGTGTGMESALVPDAGFDFCGLDVSGFDRSRPWTAITALVKVRAARNRLVEDFTRTGVPCAAVGFGAYVEVPLARAAKKLGVPLVLHEQNSVPGMANKMLARDAAVVALTYPSSQEAFERLKGPRTRLLTTGNPVRSSVLEGTRGRGRQLLGVPEDARLLLVFGGSLGARHLNEAVARLKPQILARPDLYVVQAAGRKGFEEARDALRLGDDEARRWKLLPYIDDMGSCLAAADCVLSRAGASSIAEIAARCVPSVLVPYPYATSNHQEVNARYLVEAGGALCVDDAELDSDEFGARLLALVDDPARLAGMRSALEGLGQAYAAARLADAVEDAASRAAAGPHGRA